MRLLDALLAPVRWLARFTRAASQGLSSALASLDPPSRPMLAGASGASTAAAREPYGRVFTEWTVDGVKQAESRANAGDLRHAADLCDTLFADDRIGGVFDTRVLSLFGAPLTFEPGKGRRRAKAQRAIEAEEDWWTIFPESEAAAIQRWGLGLGVGLGQLTTIEDPATGRLIPQAKAWHPRWLRFDWPTRTWRLKVDDGAREITITPGDGQWFLYTPYGATRPWAMGLWRGLARWYCLKIFAIDDWGLHSEVHGQPIRVGTTPKGTTDALRKALAAELRDLGRETALALPEGFDLRLVEASASTWQMFQAQIGLADKAFAVTVLGGNLGTDVSGGQQTGATAQEAVRQDRKQADAETFSTQAHDQVLRHWAAWNFGDPGAAPWPVWQVAPAENKAAAAALWKAVGDALVSLKSAGFKVTPEQVKDRFGLELLPIEAPPALPPTTTAPASADAPQDP